MKKLMIAVVLLLAAPAHAESDARAVEIGKAMWSALGGDRGWSQARYLRFDWIVDKEGKKVVTRSHYWDRFTGRYRVDGVDKDSGAYSIYFNTDTHGGVAFVGGKRVTDAAQAKKWLDDGYEAFINDSYWLLAPFKIFDPGVTLADAGQDKGPHGEACDVIKLSFDNVGLTPKDLYWLLIDRSSHLLVEWRFVLDGKKDPPSAFAWSDWKQVGPIQLAANKPAIGKKQAIRFESLQVSPTPDDAALTPPK